MKRWLEHASPWIGLLALIAGVWLTGYQGRVDQYNGAVRDCKQRQKSLEISATANRASAKANLIISLDPRQSPRGRKARAIEAKAQRVAAARYAARAAQDCSKQFPRARKLPR